MTGTPHPGATLGRYRISAKLNGKKLRIKQTGASGDLFGLTPKETNDAASVLFAPDEAKASMVAPQAGGWKPVDVRVEKP